MYISTLFIYNIYSKFIFILVLNFNLTDIRFKITKYLQKNSHFLQNYKEFSFDLIIVRI